jgi:hypothetical protein
MATVERTDRGAPLRCWRRGWVIVTISILGLAGAPALAAPPSWAHGKPAATTTTRAPTTTTTQVPTTTTTTTTTTTEPATTTTIERVVCSDTGGCGDWVTYAPIVCYNELGEIVAVLDPADYENPLLSDPTLFCSSGF